MPFLLWFWLPDAWNLIAETRRWPVEEAVPSLAGSLDTAKALNKAVRCSLLRRRESLHPTVVFPQTLKHRCFMLPGSLGLGGIAPSPKLRPGDVRPG